MSTETLPPPAQKQEAPDVEALRKQSEQEALKKVAAREGNIREVRTEQKKSIEQLIGAKGSDGASAETGMPEEQKAKLREAQNAVEKDAAERESRFDKKVMVSDQIGGAAGQERDEDRSVRVAAKVASVDTQRAQAVEVDEHEHRHTQQKQANESSTALTGDAEADSMLQVDHLAYREEDAMHAAGDTFTSKDYTRDYKEPVNDVAAYLNSGGENGDSLVRNAGLNGQIAEVRDAVRRVQRNKSAPAEYSQAA